MMGKKEDRGPLVKEREKLIKMVEAGKKVLKPPPK